VDRALRRGRARSRNELVARALRHELGRERRRGIDAAFAETARDPGAYAETLRVAREPSRHRALVIVLDLAGAR
jgi:metal-responsive CopG/Arc/MetJ family transcriptional regulator